MHSVPWCCMKRSLRRYPEELLRIFLVPPPPTQITWPSGSTHSMLITVSGIWPKRPPTSVQPPHPMRPPSMALA